MDKGKSRRRRFDEPKLEHRLKVGFVASNLTFQRIVVFLRTQRLICATVAPFSRSSLQFRKRYSAHISNWTRKAFPI